MSNGLGRGLGSLISSAAYNQNSAGRKLAPLPPVQAGAAGTGVLEISVDEIKANTKQPRHQFTDTKLDELAESIKEHGIIQPLIVTRVGDSYELIAGERRLRASRKAGLKTVPVIVRQAGEQEKLELALIENIQRENLNPIELAQAYIQLMKEFKLTQEEVAKQLGKPRSSIANTVRMVNLPEEVQLALQDGRVSEGHAKYLLGVDGEAKQMALFRKIIHNNLTVSDLNQEVRRMGGTRNKQVKINYADKDKEFKLREFFGSKASILRKKSGGQIIIDFYSEEELDGIIKKVS